MPTSATAGLNTTNFWGQGPAAPVWYGKNQGTKVWGPKICLEFPKKKTGLNAIL